MMIMAMLRTAQGEQNNCHILPAKFVARCITTRPDNTVFLNCFINRISQQYFSIIATYCQESLLPAAPPTSWQYNAQGLQKDYILWGEEGGMSPAQYYSCAGHYTDQPECSIVYFSP